MSQDRVVLVVSCPAMMNPRIYISSQRVEQACYHNSSREHTSSIIPREKY